MIWNRYIFIHIIYLYINVCGGCFRENTYDAGIVVKVPKSKKISC